MSQNHVNREKEINDFSTSYEIPSQVESAVMRHPEVHGGSGFAAATVGDLGFDPTLGATSADAKPATRRKVRIEVGEGLSAAGVSAAGISAAGASAGRHRQRGYRLRGLRLVGFQPGPRSAPAVRRRARGPPGAPC
jgi:hypothetical protein